MYDDLYENFNPFWKACPTLACKCFSLLNNNENWIKKMWSRIISIIVCLKGNNLLLQIKNYMPSFNKKTTWKFQFTYNSTADVIKMEKDFIKRFAYRKEIARVKSFLI